MGVVTKGVKMGTLLPIILGLRGEDRDTTLLKEVGVGGGYGGFMLRCQLMFTWA